MYTRSGKKVRIGLIIAIVCGVAILCIAATYVRMLLLTQEIQTLNKELSADFVASYRPNGLGTGTKATHGGVDIRLDYENANNVFTSLMNHGMIPANGNVADGEDSIFYDFGNGNSLELVLVGENGVFGRYHQNGRLRFFSTNDYCSFVSMARLSSLEGLSYPNTAWTD